MLSILAVAALAPAVAAVAVADTCSARLLVLADLLPGQRLRCAEAPESFAALVEDRKEPLVCVGRNQLSLHWVGCEAVVSRDESGSIVLAATDRLAQVKDDYSDDGGSKWNGRTGTVTWLGRLSEQDNLLSSDDIYSLAKAYEHGSNTGMEVGPERLAQLGKKVSELTDEFVSLAGPSVEELLKELGPAPEPEALNAQALYVAALLNPIVPIYDDLLFIRPAVLTSRSTGNRLDYAERALRDAIKRLQ